MKVSVIIPVYNVEKYLERCLDSLVRQTIDSYELIIINDGSTDQSLSICESYQNRYPQLISIYNKVNGGLSDARNYGLIYAKGDFLAFIDSDDWIDQNMLSVMYDKALENDADIAVCDMEYIYDSGDVKFSSGGEFQVVIPNDIPEIMFINNSVCNKIYQRNLFENIRFPVGWWYEDLATIPQILLSAKRIVKIDSPFYKYFQRSGSIMHSANEKIFDIYLCLERINEFIRKTDLRRRPALEIQLRKMYILYGAELTTLRIRDFTNDRIHFLRKNMQLLESHYQNWYHDDFVHTYPFKKRIVFFLLHHHCYNLLLFFYNMAKQEKE
ncbi:MAG: glycosyltransferase [Erysipelotrichaceae bacterium]|nr:glycosyltransferase [Erysipelotrichaceae bacterium]